MQVIETGDKNVKIYTDINKSFPFLRDFETAYADLIYDYCQDPRFDLQEGIKRFEGQIVVDLGAGDNTYGYQIANRAGAKLYIGVEPFHYKYLAHEIVSLRSEVPDRCKTTAIIVREDMLGFLERLPDNCVSILCSGIDRLVVNDAEYRTKVGTHILKALNPSGIYIGKDGAHIDIHDFPLDWETIVNCREASSNLAMFYTKKKRRLSKSDYNTVKN